MCRWSEYRTECKSSWSLSVYRFLTTWQWRATTENANQGCQVITKFILFFFSFDVSLLSINYYSPGLWKKMESNIKLLCVISSVSTMQDLNEYIRGNDSIEISKWRWFRSKRIVIVMWKLWTCWFWKKHYEKADWIVLRNCKRVEGDKVNHEYAFNVFMIKIMAHKHLFFENFIRSFRTRRHLSALPNYKLFSCIFTDYLNIANCSWWVFD